MTTVCILTNLKPPFYSGSNLPKVIRVTQPLKSTYYHVSLLVCSVQTFVSVWVLQFLLLHLWNEPFLQNKYDFETPNRFLPQIFFLTSYEMRNWLSRDLPSLFPFFCLLFWGWVQVGRLEKISIYSFASVLSLNTSSTAFGCYNGFSLVPHLWLMNVYRGTISALEVLILLIR